MCAHLALPLYQPYPGRFGMGYLDLYWNSVRAPGHAPASVGPAAAAAADSSSPSPESGEKRQTADVSSASSSSGNFSQFMPHLATSQHSVSSSPQPTTKSQKGREDDMGTVKKAKSCTAFSHKQLQTLHQRFQSQKYLSPQQTTELAAALGLTYQQVKTWFQNWKMKLKRTASRQVLYLDVYPKFHQDYPITATSNIQMMPTPHQRYRVGQNAYTIVISEDGGVFGKGEGSCSIQQTMGIIAQHKVDFYHSYPGNMEYSCTKTSDGYNIHQSAPMGAPFPATAGHHLYHS
ncbi:hypothetical protein ASZ78_002117 [Callipepla squamata]|uniref:Homeobox domain-containing protein n=1 Tax=Callipepla squamata TaxID=9009 RepID=A0A226MLX7_CALSU|nr:hypothetical protein ASZ78_002117 [Callipepla squamata]